MTIDGDRQERGRSMVAHAEQAVLAERQLAATCAKQMIPGTLTVHADRGSSMTSKPVAFLVADLGSRRPTPAPSATTTNTPRASSRP
jgi:putative transposase